MLGHASKWLRTLRMKFPSRYFTVSFDYRSKVEALLCLLWLEKLQSIYKKGTRYHHTSTSLGHRFQVGIGSKCHENFCRLALLIKLLKPYTSSRYRMHTQALIMWVLKLPLQLYTQDVSFTIKGRKIFAQLSQFLVPA